MLVPIAVTVVLALYGFCIALGDRPAFSAAMLEQ